MTLSLAGHRFSIAASEPYSLQFTPCDAEAEIIGMFDGTDIPAAAKKTFDEYTSWYFSVFPSDRDALREIFRKAGVHIYSEGGEALLVGCGIAVVCTDCDREIRILLKDGVEIKDTLPAMTTAVYDTATGKRLDI